LRKHQLGNNQSEVIMTGKRRDRSAGPDNERRKTPPPRRAGLRRDERDPDELPDEPGSAAGDTHSAGTAGGGLSSGGLAGTNLGDGSPDDAYLDEAFGAGIHDNLPDTEDQETPLAGADQDAALGGPSGGAVGGTPAGKRSSGGSPKGRLRPGGGGRGDSTIGRDPYGPDEQT